MDAHRRPTRAELDSLLDDVPAPEPDPPYKPLPLTETFLRDSGYDVPQVARSAAEPVSELDQAHALLQQALASLSRIAANPDTETGDRIAAIREMSRIGDTLTGAKSDRKLRTVAEVDADLATELRALGWVVTPPTDPTRG